METMVIIPDAFITDFAGKLLQEYFMHQQKDADS
jgi:hypothetical protein